MLVLATAGRGEFVGTAKIAGETGAPANYLGKLLRQLARNGLVQSRKGLGGGFRIAKPACDIPLYDVVASIDDVARWRNCVLGRGECSDDDPCPVHDRWVPVRASYLSLLTNTRLSDIAPECPEGGLENGGDAGK